MIRFFRHYVPLNLLLLVLVEALVLGGAMFVGAAAHLGQEFAQVSLSPVVPQAAVFGALLMGAMTAMGLYDPDSCHGLRALLSRLGLAHAVGFALIAAAFHFVPFLAIEREVLILSFGVALAGVLATRFAFAWGAALDALKPRALVLGAGSRAASIENLIKRRGKACSLNVLGYIPCGGLPNFVSPQRLLDTGEPLAVLAKRLDVTRLILAVRERRGGGLPMDQLLECKLAGIHVQEASDFFERENGHLQLDSLNASWMVLSEGFEQGLVRDTVKRLFDLVVSGVLLIVTLPLMLLAMALVKLESPGPALYRQERVGQGGKSFTILKFRSMRSDAEKDGKPRWAAQNDSRVTLFGRIMRRTRIDELPQIFNVFLGDMSFVGPRPERPYFVDDLARQIPHYRIRHTVKPGITGWAQVRYPYGATVEDAVHKLQYDLYYVKNHSLFLDLMILLQTAQVVIWGKGVR